MKSPNATAEILLFHGANDTFTLLSFATMTAAAKTTLRFTVTGTGTGTTLSLFDVGNSATLLTLTGSSLTALNSAGGVGIFGENPGSTVDNFLAGGS